MLFTIYCLIIYLFIYIILYYFSILFTGSGTDGQYVPDNSGSYVHVDGPNGPGAVPGGEYHHVTGPSGGVGGNGGFGGNGPSGTG